MNHVTLIASAALVLGLGLNGCASDTRLIGAGNGWNSPETTLDGSDAYPEFDGATLVVYEPASAAIYELGVEMPFDAEILGADGEVLDFEDIVWESDIVEDQILVGKSGEEVLPWGVHTIVASADLPNGDRLSYALGGIRVQSKYAGIWGGNMRMAIDVELQGVPVTAACVGGLNFTIDMTGERMLGEDSSCSMEIPVIGNMNLEYGVTGDVAEQGDVDGTIGLNLAGFFDIPIDWNGELDQQQFQANFDGVVDFFVGQFPMEGSLDAIQISPYVDPSLSE